MKRLIAFVQAYFRKTGMPSGLVARAALIFVTAVALALGLRGHPLSAGGFPAAMALLLVLETLELLFASRA